MSRRLLAAFVAALFALAWAAPALTSQAQPPAKKAKKVWTNEDLEALRPGGITISATPVAPPAASSAAGEAATKESADKADEEKKGKEEDPVEKLLKRLAPLRLELASVEAQLQSLRQARSTGNTTGAGMDVSKAPGGLTTENQVAQLGNRRADLLRQISSIEDEARRLGIAPGALR